MLDPDTARAHRSSNGVGVIAARGIPANDCPAVHDELRGTLDDSTSFFVFLPQHYLPFTGTKLQVNSCETVVCSSIKEPV